MKKIIGILKGKRIGRKDLRKMLDKSLAAQNLKKIFKDKGKILVIVPDSTRSGHLKTILPEFLNRIKGPRRKIDIIVATGLHKKHTAGQLKDLVGKKIFRRFRVFCHDQNRKSLMRLGRTRRGVPIVLNKRLKDCDAIVSIGVIEPHLYAGYSGGIKTIAIGLAGEETINATHGVRFLDDPGTRLGSIRGNPFQDTLWEIARDAHPLFCINIVNDADGNALAVFCGKAKEVFEKGVRMAKGVFEVKAKKRADIVICGIGRPKDINLYQASRAINYVVNVARPVLKKNGVLIIAASLADGIGGGITEKRFYKELKEMRSPGEFVKKIQRRGCIAGVHRAYMVAKPLLDYHIVFVTKPRRGFMDGLPFPFFVDISGALIYARPLVGKDPDIYMIPRTLSTIARRF